MDDEAQSKKEKLEDGLYPALKLAECVCKKYTNEIFAKVAKKCLQVIPNQRILFLDARTALTFKECRKAGIPPHMMLAITNDDVDFRGLQEEGAPAVLQDLQMVLAATKTRKQKFCALYADFCGTYETNEDVIFEAMVQRPRFMEATFCRRNSKHSINDIVCRIFVLAEEQGLRPCVVNAVKYRNMMNVSFTFCPMDDCDGFCGTVASAVRGIRVPVPMMELCRTGHIECHS